MRLVLMLAILLTLIAQPARAGEPHILFSPDGACHTDGIACWEGISPYFVFIDVTGIDDAIGVSFRFESSTLAPENIVALEPHENVTVYGDLFAGILLSFPVGSYVKDTLLTVPMAYGPPTYTGWEAGRTVDVMLFRASGELLHLPDGVYYCTHCNSGSSWVTWLHPDTVFVPAGHDTTIAVKCKTQGAGSSWSDIAASDDMGWLTDCPSCFVEVECGSGCPWDCRYVNIHMSIPPGTGAGTLDQVTLTPTGPCCTSGPTPLIVKTVAPVAVEAASWSELKGLFRDE